jgi:hypothetical protein
MSSSANYRIELYRGPEWTFFGTTPFLPIVKRSLQRLYGWDPDRMLVKIAVVSVPQEATLTGVPVVENLMPDFGFTYVTVIQEGHVIYQHPHPLDDIVTQVLQEELRREYPEETVWGFRLDLPGMPPLSRRRPTPAVQGAFDVRPFAEGDRPRFQIRRVEEEPLRPLRLADHGIRPVDGEAGAPVKVLLSAALASDLLVARPLSLEVEEGGFLIGRAYTDADRDGAHIVAITDALTARYTGASLLHFTFTGDSFAEVKQSLRSREQGERIVGWYHTHLFAATEAMGLSSIDLTLHFNTFRVPWQLAGLINIDFEKRARVLRFYVREGDRMVQCPHWTPDVLPTEAERATGDGSGEGPE